MSIRMLNNLVAVRRDDSDNVTSSGIVLTTTVKDSKGIVIAVGPGVYTANGDFIETSVKVGDEILFHKDTGNEMEIDGETMLIMSEANVIGILK